MPVNFLEHFRAPAVPAALFAVDCFTEDTDDIWIQIILHPLRCTTKSLICLVRQRQLRACMMYPTFDYFVILPEVLHPLKGVAFRSTVMFRVVSKPMLSALAFPIVAGWTKSSESSSRRTDLQSESM